MKRVKDLTKAEKIEFLKQIQAGKINPKRFTEPVFLTNRGDAFLALMQERHNAIPITPEAIRDAQELKKATNSPE